ncbi:peptidylprolyl isomerase [Anaeromicropila populeti]|uniref:PPIC-type PPIASE domain-containing protein n=1 Tax=Anaeromicropila populeti TaxID=37658 RepID=A0A1I6IY69_9FIRM|nr:peptidylprolyl isomerase [Anaeromicropila populeti]SFR71581.1 PPIC-type PPIASE domain-containing protein [Anaeromicropila populeti]
MNARRIFFWGVMAMLMLSGCKKEVAVGNMVPEKTQALDEKQDTTLETDTVVMTVGDEEIEYQEVLFYIYKIKQDYEKTLSAGVWTFEVADGVSFEDYAKEEIINELTELKIICQQAVSEGVTLTDDELADLKQQANTFLYSLSEEDIQTYGFTQELIEKIYGEHALANKMFDVTTGEVDTSISNEEVRQIKVQYLLIMTNGVNKEGKNIQMNEKEKKAAYKEAKKLYEEAKKSTDFYNFAMANSDLDEVELIFGQEEKPDEFGSQAVLLKTGELSKIIEGNQGYYIVYCVSDCDEDATFEKKEEIIQQRQTTVFESSYSTWSEQYKVVVSKPLWERIVFGEETEE